MQTDRDAQIVDWLGRIGAAGAQHVAERFDVNIPVAYKRLRSLAVDGLLQRQMILYGRPGMYVATRRGLRWQGLSRLGVFRGVSPGGYEHAWQVSTVAVALHRMLPAWRIVGEREIKALEIDDGYLFASVRTGSTGSNLAVHRPDLAVVSPSGRVIAVEVELSAKERPRLTVICRGYARARHLDHVYYLAAPRARHAVERELDRVKATDRVTVLDLEDVAGLAAHALAREEARNVLPS